MLAREERRKPNPGLLERDYLDELRRLGIDVGTYHLPDWENDPESFHRCMDSLFQFTPPTALLSEPLLFFAIQQHLLGKGLRVPRDVSLLSLDNHPSFEWFLPEVSVIRTDISECVPCVVQWVNNLANGRKGNRHKVVRAEFIEGATIGPAH